MKLGDKSPRNTKDVKALKETPRGYKSAKGDVPARGCVTTINTSKKGRTY